MGINYTKKYIVHDATPEQLKDIGAAIETELYGTYSPEDNEFWHTCKGSVDTDFFKALSTAYENVVFECWEARTEDFGFQNTDITKYVFINGKEISCYCDIVPMLSHEKFKLEIQNAKKHYHVYNIFVKAIGESSIIMACDCGDSHSFDKV